MSKGRQTSYHYIGFPTDTTMSVRRKSFSTDVTKLAVRAALQARDLKEVKSELEYLKRQRNDLLKRFINQPMIRYSSSGGGSGGRVIVPQARRLLADIQSNISRTRPLMLQAPPQLQTVVPPPSQEEIMASLRRAQTRALILLSPSLRERELNKMRTLQWQKAVLSSPTRRRDDLLKWRGTLRESQTYPERSPALSRQVLNQATVNLQKSMSPPQPVFTNYQEPSPPTNLKKGRSRSSRSSRSRSRRSRSRGSSSRRSSRSSSRRSRSKVKVKSTSQIKSQSKVKVKSSRASKQLQLIQKKSTSRSKRKPATLQLIQKKSSTNSRRTRSRQKSLESSSSTLQRQIGVTVRKKLTTTQRTPTTTTRLRTVIDKTTPQIRRSNAVSKSKSKNNTLVKPKDTLTQAALPVIQS
jgi:hypothetical protein